MLFERFQIQMFPAMRTSLVSQTRSATAGVLQHLEGAKLSAIGVYQCALFRIISISKYQIRFIGITRVHVEKVRELYSTFPMLPACQIRV